MESDGAEQFEQILLHLRQQFIIVDVADLDALAFQAGAIVHPYGVTGFFAANRIRRGSGRDLRFEH